MTDVTTSQNYKDALQEAAEFMKTHQSKDELPAEIVEKAIGKKPPYCDSPDTDTMMEARDSFNKYRRDTQLFIQRAVELSTQ